MSYLERYRAGEYETVWKELVDLGATVRQEAVSADAYAVARETMHRVRTNILTLIDRLVRIGFVFGYDHLLLESLHSLNTVTARERMAYIEMLTWMREQPPVFFSARQVEEEQAEYIPGEHPFGDPDDWDERQTLAMKHALHEIEQTIGPVPFSVRAWYEEVGAVNFFGYHDRWYQLVRSFKPTLFSHIPVMGSTFFMSFCDPLQVCPIDKAFTAQLLQTYTSEKHCRFEFAPDNHFKDYCGGSTTPYGFPLPDADADAIMGTSYQTGTFVQYLRVCLSWAGFPGMMHWPVLPKDDLAFLTHDLIPF